MTRFSPTWLLLPLLCLAAAPHKPLPLPKPADLAPSAVLVFELAPLGNSAHSNGRRPIRAQVWLPQNWDKDHAFPLWLHLGGEDGWDEKGLAYFSEVFERKNMILMTVDFPAQQAKENGLATAVQAIKGFVQLTQAKVDFANLGVSGYTDGARAIEANAIAGGRELSAFRFRVLMGGGKLEDLAQNPGPGAHWLRVGKKPLKAFTALEHAGHECDTLETTRSPMAKAHCHKIEKWFTDRFQATRLAKQCLKAAKQAPTPEAQVRALAPVAGEFLDFPDIQAAKEMLAKAQAQLKQAKP